MQFEQGKAYTRDEIHGELGGETMTYLPQRGGRIVCGCFDRKMNPAAPIIVLVGRTLDQRVEQKARLLAEQSQPIPVFMKQESNKWVYKGLYRFGALIEDPNWIAERAQEAERSDVVMALVLKPVEPSVKTYLLTWNPQNWTWKTLESQVRQTAEGIPSISSWSCGNTKRIMLGDRLFLLRQGKKPRGIMAAGWAISESYVGEHWDEERKASAENANLVEVCFDRILNPEFDEILHLDKLRVGPLGSVNWATPASGIEIKQGADDLERMWSDLLRIYQPSPEIDDDSEAIEGETRLSLTRHRARESWLREKKIALAISASNGHLPCEICEFDFLNTYGELGRNYAQVHHLKPLADRSKPSSTKLPDLAVVCANCHMMIHRGGQVRSLDEIRRAISSSR